MKKHLSTIILILAFIAGLSLLLYPSVSDYVNSLHQSRAIVDYAEDVAGLNHEDYEKLLESAAAYNAALVQKSNPWSLTEDELQQYDNMLRFGQSDVMSYIEIPKINCNLPIYHGVEEGVLQTGIGHIPGSSLPVGGTGSHCVLSGHRGLPSAKLFTDLDRLVEGDIFIIRTLDETLTYEVDQIRIVLPDEVDTLRIVPGQDYCTLVTCTPYGVNSHRLLVRGHRIENTSVAKTVRVPADAIQIEPVIVAPFVAIPILLILLLWALTGRKSHSRRTRSHED